MKKILVIFMAALLSLLMVACDEENESEAESGSQTESESVVSDTNGETDAETETETETDVGDTDAEETEKVEDKVEVVPAVPAVSIVTNADEAVLTIEKVEGADSYEIYLNGNYVAITSEITYTFVKDALDIGTNEIYVRAHNSVGYSENSDVVTTVKLASPEFGLDGAVISFPWGDIENAEGYVITALPNSLEDIKVEIGGTYDFGTILDDGIYFPSIYAYAEGYVSSDHQAMLLIVGDGGGTGGGIGCTFEHNAPTLSVDGNILYITENTTEYYDGEYHPVTTGMSIYADGEPVTTVSSEKMLGDAPYELDLRDLGLGAGAHTIVVSDSCDLHDESEIHSALVTWMTDGSCAYEHSAPQVSCEILAGPTLKIAPASKKDGEPHPTTVEVYVDGKLVGTVAFTSMEPLYFSRTYFGLEPGTYTIAVKDACRNCMAPSASVAITFE